MATKNWGAVSLYVPIWGTGLREQPCCCPRCCQFQCLWDGNIARNIYCKVIEIVSAQDPTASITVDIPYGSGCNPEALGIAVDLSGTTEVNLVRMYTKGVPPLMPLHKIFAETTLELG